MRSAFRIVFYLAMTAAIAPAPEVAAENWASWRGPEGNGVSSEKDPPTRWGPTENVAWKAETKGRGSSSPAVWGEKIFMTSQTEDQVEWVLGLDRATGRTLWERPVGHGMRRTRSGANMASASPSADGEVVVASFGTGPLVAFDHEGTQLWKRNLEQDNGKFTVWWGYSNSPVVHGDLVLVNVVNEGASYLLALDKLTGEQRWKTPRKTPCEGEPCDSYATPLVYESGGTTEVFVTGGLWATAYDFFSGELLWDAVIGGDRTIASPTHDGENVYVTSGKRGPLYAIRTGGRGSIDRTHIRWKHLRSTPDVPSPLAYGDYVYFVNDTGIAMCVAKSDGELMWRERIGGNFFSSPIAADGKLFFLNRDGEMSVLAAGPEFRLLEVNELGEPATLASPALSEGQLFVRGERHLFCIGERR